MQIIYSGEIKCVTFLVYVDNFTEVTSEERTGKKSERAEPFKKMLKEHHIPHDSDDSKNINIKEESEKENSDCTEIFPLPLNL